MTVHPSEANSHPSSYKQRLRFASRLLRCYVLDALDVGTSECDPEQVTENVEAKAWQLQALSEHLPQLYVVEQVSPVGLAAGSLEILQQAACKCSRVSLLNAQALQKQV